ncbi:MAG: LPS export ABC transporter periplasmic protein LptC [Muribaculaceae bacterium]|nr:LPS export ABC transporter periplasmic protein LptC [Muribaculaceae bacterium]
MKKAVSGILTLRVLPAVVLMAQVTMVACSETTRTYIPDPGDPEHVPTMTTTNVETLISDSGYIRYRITAPLWKMYEDVEEPHWDFPEGLSLQQFDLMMRPQATMDCDSAQYLSQKRIWRLDGYVKMVNTLKDTFLTTQVFWDQARREVYTDSFVHIVRAERILEGYGFTSNEDMTRYTIHRPTGIIPLDRTAGATAGSDTSRTTADSTPSRDPWNITGRHSPGRRAH